MYSVSIRRQAKQFYLEYFLVENFSIKGTLYFTNNAKKIKARKC